MDNLEDIQEAFMNQTLFLLNLSFRASDPRFHNKRVTERCSIIQQHKVTKCTRNRRLLGESWDLKTASGNVNGKQCQENVIAA